jgi:hypothetical protein
MDLVTKLQTAIFSTKNVHSEHKRLTKEAMTIIDRRMETEGWAGRLHCCIKLVKKCIGKEGITPELDNELDDLIKERVHMVREHASINRDDDRLLAQMEDTETKSRAAWADVSAVFESIWDENINIENAAEQACITDIHDGQSSMRAIVLSADLSAKIHAAVRIDRDIPNLEQRVSTYQTDIPRRKLV